MSTIVIWRKKFLITVLVALFGLGTVSAASVYALGAAESGPLNLERHCLTRLSVVY